jgi:hypothetical protein
MINADGSIDYRGYTLMISDIYVHVWRGAQFIETLHGEPQLALRKTKKFIDERED